MSRHSGSARTAAVAAALILAGTALALPGATSLAASSRTVTIHFGIYQDPARDVVAQKQAALFMKTHPHIRVVVDEVPYASYYQKLGIEMAAGSAWDVFMINGAYFAEAAPQGRLMDLSPLIHRSHIALGGYTLDPYNSVYKGQTYALPYELDMTALFYNKNLFRAAHVPFPKAGWTWATLSRDAKLLTRTRDGKTVQWGFYSQNLYPALTSVIAENGGSILNGARTRSTLDTPAAIGAIRYLVSFIRDHESPGPNSLPAGIDPLMTGKVAIVPDYSFSVLPDLKAPFQWGVAPWPKGKRYGAAYWTQGIAIFRGTHHPHAAWSFARFLMSWPAQLIQAQARGATPSLKAIARSTAYTKAPPTGMSAFVDQYSQGGTAIQFNRQWFNVMGTPNAALESNLAPAWLLQERVSVAVKKASAAIDQVLAGH